jgi:hypothetical protein
LTLLSSRLSLRYRKYLHYLWSLLPKWVMFLYCIIIEHRMLFERRQQENVKPVVAVVKVTPQSLAALIKSQKTKGLIPATLHTNDAGEKVFRPVLAALNY